MTSWPKFCLGWIKFLLVNTKIDWNVIRGGDLLDQYALFPLRMLPELEIDWKWRDGIGCKFDRLVWR
jgi:hypothetical protein